MYGMPVNAFEGSEEGCGKLLRVVGAVLLAALVLTAYCLVFFNVREMDVRVCRIEASGVRGVAYNVYTSDGSFRIISETFGDDSEVLRGKISESGVYRFNYKRVKPILGRKLRGADPISEKRPDLVCPT